MSAETYKSWRPDLWLWYYDPRIGLLFFGPEIIANPIFTLVSAAWVLVVGLLLLSGRPLIRAYVISEVALSAPNLLFVLWVLAVNMSPAHGFSVRELPPVVCVMIIFSFVPLILAYYADRSLGGLLAGWARSSTNVGAE
jgi:uncharacterized membrane protein YoaK (UPF0700 family)